MSKVDIDSIYNRIISKDVLKPDDIPELDLYMDQIMTLFDEKLKDEKRNEDDKILTKTMINNYSKAGVITPVKGKKYNKEQIIQMLIVYNLKNSLTIQEIKKALNPIYESDISVEDIYNEYLDMRSQEKPGLEKIAKSYLDSTNLNINDDKQCLISLLLLSGLVNQLNTVIEQIIDQKYIEE